MQDRGPRIWGDSEGSVVLYRHRTRFRPRPRREPRLPVPTTARRSSMTQTEVPTRPLSLRGLPDLSAWRVLSRSHDYRAFDASRIAKALAAALRAADGGTLSEDRLLQAGMLAASVCDRIVARHPDGGAVRLEEIQDFAELALMRAGEHEAARRYVLYREERRRERLDQTDSVKADPEVESLLESLADPLVHGGLERFVLFPIRHEDAWKAYKEHLALFWTAEEIDLSRDLSDWRKLSDGERRLLDRVRGFFAASDCIVAENLAARFYSELKAPEARCYYAMQLLIEGVHAETYSLLLDTLHPYSAERTLLLNAAETLPSVAAKARWALSWLDSGRPLAERLAAFAVVEGVFFSSSFASIYWLKESRPGMMPGLTFSNELISRDEGLHTDFAVLLLSHLQEHAQPEAVLELVREAVEVESAFVDDALPERLPGLSRESLKAYVRFVADRLLAQMGLSPIWNEDCPLPFMERLALSNKTNFHERKVSEYRRPGVGHSEADRAITFDAEF